MIQVSLVNHLTVYFSKVLEYVDLRRILDNGTEGTEKNTSHNVDLLIGGMYNYSGNWSLRVRAVSIHDRKSIQIIP